MEDNRVLRLENIDNLEISNTAEDLLPYLQVTEEERRKNEELKLLLSDKDKILEKLNLVEGEIASEDSVKILIEVCEAIEDIKTYDFCLKVIDVFEKILENMLNDLTEDKKFELFKYNLVAQVKKLLNQMERNDTLKDTVKIFDSKTKFRRLLDDREKYLLEEINKRGLINKKRINEEKRRRRKIKEESELVSYREKMKPDSGARPSQNSSN